MRFKSVGRCAKSLPAILRRVSNPVKSFGLLIVQNRLPLPFLGDIRDGLGQPANLLQQSGKGHVNVAPADLRCFPGAIARGLNRR